MNGIQLAEIVIFATSKKCLAIMLLTKCEANTTATVEDIKAANS